MSALRREDRATLRLAEKIIGQAGRDNPADSVLRKELKLAYRLGPEEKRLVAQAVFAYYRWLGWKPSLEKALELDARYQKDPKSVSIDDLRQKAIPPWAAEAVEIPVEWLQRLQSPPTLWLRARTGKQKLLAEKLRTTPGRGTSLLYSGNLDLFHLPQFHAGDFEIQDIASQAVTWLADPKPGETWWDCCAGEGGKTLHLSDAMNGKGMIVASDVAEWRLTKLKRRAARASAFNYRAVPWKTPADKLPTKTLFDGILLDAPCSGLGTWQRNPHARWTTTRGDVDELAALQKKLLGAVAKALKPKAKLIYAVCTFTKSETTGVADWFEESHPGFEPIPFTSPFNNSGPEPRLMIWPQNSNGGGMFVAGWRRTL